MIGNRQMTDEEYRDYVRISGEAIARRLRPAAALLERMSAERAQDYVDRVVREERARAKARLRVRSFEPLNN